MKTKAILQKLTGLLVIMSLFFSCQKDLEIVENEDIEVGEGSIAFSFEHVSGMLKNSACDMQDVMAAVITVENSDGSMTDYNSTPVNVYKLGDRVFTQKISLNPGAYNLTEFVLVDSSLNMIYAIPAEGSSLESAVPDPLPMEFSVEKDMSLDYPVEVVCFDGFTEDDFGLAWFGISEADMCYFRISVSELGSNKLLNAYVSVTSDDYGYEQQISYKQVSDGVVPNPVLIECGLQQYKVSVSMPGYESWSETYTSAELEAHKNEPIVVELLPLSCGEIFVTDLVAAQDNVVGKVMVIPEGDKLTVVYEITKEDWYLSETHLSVTETLSGVPQSGGNPSIGNFEYTTTHNPVVSSYTYSDIDVSSVDNVVIMAHAKVSNYNINLDAIEEVLPDEKVDVEVRFTGDPSYFETTINGGGAIDGTYPGNCVDLDHGIVPGRNYQMNLVSSYTGDANLLGLLVDKPQNLDLVNYAINQDYSDLGATGREMQAVVWTLIDDIKPSSGTGGIYWNQSIVDDIVEDAVNNGEGFTPNCGEKALVIVDPGVKQDPSLIEQVTFVQITTVAIENTCEPVSIDETAWGEGNPFGGGSWAMYFDYCIR